MSVFRKSNLDNGIPQKFWIENLPNFSKLIILDLKFICTDEILQIVGVTCPLLEEFNIVSRIDICKSPFNASVLIRNVSDGGLRSLANLKHLRILAMDPPRNERMVRVGRCVSQAGIIMLVKALPYLEELRIDTCDIGNTLIGSDINCGPLSLRKINSHFASADGIRKLIKLCPYLKELSVTHLSEHNKEAILKQISISDLRLSKLDLSFYSFTNSLQELLAIKGCYLTHFSLWESENTLSLDELIAIGTYCPNLHTLRLLTQSKRLIVPRYYRRTLPYFSQLKSLTLGNDNFDIHELLTFFLDCTRNIQKLVLKYQTKINLDAIMLHILGKGYLNNVNCIWLDCTFEVSKAVIKKIIESCEQLQMFTVDFNEDMSDVQKYIIENNLDLKLGSY